MNDSKYIFFGDCISILQTDQNDDKKYARANLAYAIYGDKKSSVRFESSNRFKINNMHNFTNIMEATFVVMPETSAQNTTLKIQYQNEAHLKEPQKFDKIIQEIVQQQSQKNLFYNQKFRLYHPASRSFLGVKSNKPKNMRKETTAEGEVLKPEVIQPSTAVKEDAKEVEVKNEPGEEEKPENQVNAQILAENQPAQNQAQSNIAKEDEQGQTEKVEGQVITTTLVGKSAAQQQFKKDGKEDLDQKFELTMLYNLEEDTIFELKEQKETDLQVQKTVSLIDGFQLVSICRSAKSSKETFYVPREFQQLELKKDVVSLLTIKKEIPLLQLISNQFYTEYGMFKLKTIIDNQIYYLCKNLNMKNSDYMDSNNPYWILVKKENIDKGAHAPTYFSVKNLLDDEKLRPIQILRLNPNYIDKVPIFSHYGLKDLNSEYAISYDPSQRFSLGDNQENDSKGKSTMIFMNIDPQLPSVEPALKDNINSDLLFQIMIPTNNLESSFVLTYPEDIQEREVKEITEFNDKPCWYNARYKELISELEKQKKRVYARQKVDERNNEVDNYFMEQTKKREEEKKFIPAIEKNPLLEEVPIPESIFNKEIDHILDDDFSELGVDEVEKENEEIILKSDNEFLSEYEKTILPVKVGKIFTHLAINFSLEPISFIEYGNSYTIKSLRSIIGHYHQEKKEEEILNCLKLLRNFRGLTGYRKNTLIQTQVRIMIGELLCTLIQNEPYFTELFPIFAFFTEGHYYNDIWLLNMFPLDQNQILSTQNINDKTFQTFIKESVYIQNKKFLMNKEKRFVEKKYLESLSYDSIDELISFIQNTLKSNQKWSESELKSINDRKLEYQFKINNFSIIFGGGENYGYNTQDYITYDLERYHLDKIDDLKIVFESRQSEYPIIILEKYPSDEFCFLDQNIPLYDFLIDVMKINIFMYSNERYYFLKLGNIYGNGDSSVYDYLFEIISKTFDESNQQRSDYLHELKFRALNLLNVLIFSKTVAIPNHVFINEEPKSHVFKIQGMEFDRSIYVKKLRNQLYLMFNPVQTTDDSKDPKDPKTPSNKEILTVNETERDEEEMNLTEQESRGEFAKIEEKMDDLFLPTKERINFLRKCSEKEKAIHLPILIKNLDHLMYILQSDMLFDGLENENFYLANLQSLENLIKLFEERCSYADKNNDVTLLKYQQIFSFLFKTYYNIFSRTKMLLAKKYYKFAQDNPSANNIEGDSSIKSLVDNLRNVTLNLELPKKIIQPDYDLDTRADIALLSFEMTEIPTLMKHLHEIPVIVYEKACELQNFLFELQTLKNQMFDYLIYSDRIYQSDINPLLGDMFSKLGIMLLVIISDNNEHSTYMAELQNYQFCYANKVTFFVNDYTSLNNKDILNFDFRQMINRDLLQILKSLNIHQHFYKILMDFFDVYGKLNLDYMKLRTKHYIDENNCIKIMSQVFKIRTIITKILCLFIENSEENAISMKETIETDENISKLRRNMINKDHNQALLMTTIISSICKTLGKYNNSEGSLSIIIYLESLIEQTFKSIEDFNPFSFDEETRKISYCRNCVYLAMYYIKVSPAIFKYKTLIPYASSEKSCFESISNFIADFYFKFVKFFNDEVYIQFYYNNYSWNSFTFERYDFFSKEENRKWDLSLNNLEKISLPLDELISITHTFVKNLISAINGLEDNRQAYDLVLDKFYNKYSKDSEIFSQFEGLAHLVLPLRLDLKQKIYNLIIRTMFDANKFTDFSSYHNLHIIKVIEGLSIEVLCWFDHLGIGLPSEVVKFNNDLPQQIQDFRNKDSRNSTHYYRKHISMMIEEKAREKDPLEISAATRNLTRMLGFAMRRILFTMNYKDRTNHLEIRKGSEEQNYNMFRILYVILFQTINNSKINWAFDDKVRLSATLYKFRNFFHNTYIEFETFPSFEAFMKYCEAKSYVNLMREIDDSIYNEVSASMSRLSVDLIKSSNYNDIWKDNESIVISTCKKISDFFNNYRGSDNSITDTKDKFGFISNDFNSLGSFFDNYGEQLVQNKKPFQEQKFQLNNQEYINSIKSTSEIQNDLMEISEHHMKNKTLAKHLSCKEGESIMLSNDELSSTLNKLLTVIKIVDVSDPKLVPSLNIILRLLMDYITAINSFLLRPIENARAGSRIVDQRYYAEFDDQLREFEILLYTDLNKSVIYSTELIDILIKVMSTENVQFKTFSLTLSFVNLLVQGQQDKKTFQTMMLSAFSKLDIKSKSMFGENIRRFLNETWEFIERDESNILNWMVGTKTYEYIYQRTFRKSEQNFRQVSSSKLFISQKKDIEQYKQNPKLLKGSQKNLEVFQNVLTLIKNLCENHNAEWKNYFFTETRIFSEILVKKILVQYYQSVNHLNIELGIRIAETILEILQGQTQDNITPLLISGEIYKYTCKLFGLCGKLQLPTKYMEYNEDNNVIVPFVEILNDRSDLLTFLSEILLCLIEFFGPEDRKQFLSELLEKRNIDSLNKNTINFFKDMNWIARKKKELSDPNKIIMLEKKIKNRIFSKVQLNDYDFINFFIPLINYFIVLKMLNVTEQEMKDNILMVNPLLQDSESIEKKQNRIRKILFLRNFAVSFIKSIEIVDENRNLRIKYFPKYIQCYAVENGHTEPIIDSLDRTSYDTKIGTFFANFSMFNLKLEMNYNALSTLKSYIKVKSFKAIEFCHFLFAFILNVLLLSYSAAELDEIANVFDPRERTTQNTIAFGGLVLLQVFLSFFVLLSLFITDPETHFIFLKNWEIMVKRFFQNEIPLRSDDIVILLREPQANLDANMFRRIMLRHGLDNPLLFMFEYRTLYYYPPLYIFRGILKLVTTFLDHRIFLYILDFGFCIGSIFHPLCVTFQILFQVMRSNLIRDVLKSLFVNLKPFFYTISLGLSLILLYTLIGFYFLISTMQVDDDKLNIMALKNETAVVLPIVVSPNNLPFCDSLWECFINFINHGIRSGGGVGDILNKTFERSDDLYTSRFFFDMTFYILLIIIMLNLIFGIIINTFTNIRDKKIEDNKDQISKCFICDLEKVFLDKIGDGFDYHYKKEHNMWDYFYYLYYLKQKGLENLSIFENFVWSNYKKNNFQWVPANQALCVIASQNQDELSIKNALLKLQDTRSFLDKVSRDLFTSTTGNAGFNFRAYSFLDKTMFDALSFTNSNVRSCTVSKGFTPRLQPRIDCKTCGKKICKLCSEVCHSRHVIEDTKREETFTCDCVTNCSSTFTAEMLASEKICVQNCVNFIDPKNDVHKNCMTVTCECTAGSWICLFCALYCHKKLKKCKGIQTFATKKKGSQPCGCKAEFGSSCFGVKNHYQFA